MSICLDNNKSATLESLSVTLEMAHNLEEKTREGNGGPLAFIAQKKNTSIAWFLYKVQLIRKMLQGDCNLGNQYKI